MTFSVPMPPYWLCPMEWTHHHFTCHLFTLSETNIAFSLPLETGQYNYQQFHLVDAKWTCVQHKRESKITNTVYLWTYSDNRPSVRMEDCLFECGTSQSSKNVKSYLCDALSTLSSLFVLSAHWWKGRGSDWLKGWNWWKGGEIDGMWGGGNWWKVGETDGIPCLHFMGPDKNKTDTMMKV